MLRVKETRGKTLVADSLGALREFLRSTPGEVGFVPTMGALHPGHASLMEQAREKCDVVVVSVFVNPTQFAPGEDFQSYPRTRARDLEVCERAGVDLVWFPTVEELYPEACETWVEVEGLGRRFEGESRPEHFRGVATVVAKLFHAVAPDMAFFGQKDLQQLYLVRKMVRDLLFDVEVVGVPTAREPSGLARSSRNVYLSQGEQREAARIFQGLQAVKSAFQRGVASYEELRECFCDRLQGWPSAELERFDLYDSELRRAFLPGQSVTAGYCAVAVKVGKVRLIDNIELTCC